ncbi:MAG TPA: MqnA/MqnD/SBP family protein [Candidatus Thermoplasmatota archaeon]|nr:MqnA/MqnD/SBP family protein [Candidatus Thermoplasmatota archaeon]
MTDRPLVRVGHSPDPDDAFMAWALAEGVLTAEDFDVELVAKDIETLNRWAVEDARLEATALSAAAFARVADRYWLLPHGASFGEGYGPVVVRRADAPPLASLDGVAVATPGELTTAFAALRMAAPGARWQHERFERILPRVKDGTYDAGLLIHEGQLTYAREGLAKVLDLGEWWQKETGGLPLPLGVVALRRDLGAEMGAEVNALLKASLETGLAMRKRALAYAKRFGRGIADEDADRFVRMYVNDLTRDMRPRGLDAVKEFLRRAAAAGVVPRGARVELAPED